MLEVGESAPSFGVPGTDGDDIERYRLSEYADSGAVVLLFYPFDFSPVCTEELCNFRDSELLTFTPDLDVFGVSTDSAFAHQRYATANDLPFPLLSDHDGDVAEAYGVLTDAIEGHDRVADRAVFVVDDAETVRYAWRAEEWTVDPDVHDVYDTVRELDCIDVDPPGSDD